MAVKWAMVAMILAVGLLLAYAYVYRSLSKPDEKSFTIEGYVTHACGFIVPADTKDDRAIARGMRLDCGIFEPGYKYGVWR